MDWSRTERRKEKRNKVSVEGMRRKWCKIERERWFISGLRGKETNGKFVILQEKMEEKKNVGNNK